MMKKLQQLIVLIFTYVSQTSMEEQTTQSPTNTKCRTRSNHYLDQNEFNIFACRECYGYMPVHSKIKFEDIPLSYMENVTSLESFINDSSILQLFRNGEARKKWASCCLEAQKCCVRMLQDPKTHELVYCPRTWDGWLCWEDSLPSTTQSKECPSYTTFEQEVCPDAHALKKCDGGGKWGKHASEDREWTDYTPCSAKIVMEKRIYVSLAAFATSFILLIPALVIFQIYRTLQCHRIVIHKNLFASLLLNCASEITFKSAIIMAEFNGASVLKKNGADCKAFLILTKYFRLTNYMWMFCEGFYLHRQIFNVFAEETNLKLFYIIGWGLPIIPVTTFAVLRYTTSDIDCWATTSLYDWALHIPSLFSLLINAFFLANILRVLVTRFHRNHPGQFRKAVRATLILVPLFGLHFVVTFYRSRGICSIWSEIYVYLDYLIDGLQGSVVAIIFCYSNSEVTVLLKRSWRTVLEEHHLGHRHSIYNGTTTSVMTSQTAV